MTGLDWVLLSAIGVLAVLVLGGFLLGAKALRRISARPTPLPAETDPEFLAEKGRREESLIALRDAAQEASSAVDSART
ncbi:MAG TPA: ribonuclease Y, partial [Pilimelia sp.]|nr:ribonuclease Y [Pilimelia sp.]